MSVSLEVSYRHCGAIARRTGKNFYYSFLVMPRLKREAMCAIYAFMRHSDDIADSAANPAVASEALRQWRASVDAAFGRTGILPVSSSEQNGQDARSTYPILPALLDTIQRYGIEPRHFHEL